MRLRSPRNWCQNHESLVFDVLSLTEFITIVINFRLVTFVAKMKVTVVLTIITLWGTEICTITIKWSKYKIENCSLWWRPRTLRKCAILAVASKRGRSHQRLLFWCNWLWDESRDEEKRSWCISFNLLTAHWKIFACWICKVAISSADPLLAELFFCFPPCALFAVYLNILRLLMLIEI